MDIINYIEMKKATLVDKLQEELLFMGAGVDNSAYIDKLSAQIKELEDNIDIFYCLYKVPRTKVMLTPYAYLHKLSSTREVLPFIDKLDVPTSNPIMLVEVNTVKMVGIMQNIK